MGIKQQNVKLNIYLCKNFFIFSLLFKYLSKKVFNEHANNILNRDNIKEEPRNRFMLPNVFSSDNDFRKSNNNITGSLINIAEKRISNNGNYINMNQGKNEFSEKELYSNDAYEKKATFNIAYQISNRVKSKFLFKNFS